jgi:hypothetical protein
MSRYATIKTAFKDEQSLIETLMETGGWSESQIEVHDVPQHLFGYKGDKRQKKANIIIRKQYVGKYSNDLGFIKDEEGNYEAIISDYDSSKYGKEWMGKLKGNYVYHKVHRDMEARGRSVTRELCGNGLQRITVTGYR